MRGAGWFAFAANGKTVYTRDGRFHINDLGDLKTVNNYNVLDPGGAPITIDPAAGPVTIGEDGAISQGKSQIGALGVFLIPETAKLTHHDNSGVISDKPAVPAEDMTVNGVRQGYLESSNVNPIVEMTKLIEVSRAFDNAVAATQSGDTTTDDMIKTLGPTS